MVQTKEEKTGGVKNGVRRKMTERTESWFFAREIDRTESNVLIRSLCPWRDNSFLPVGLELTLDNFQPQHFPRFMSPKVKDYSHKDNQQLVKKNSFLISIVLAF